MKRLSDFLLALALLPLAFVAVLVAALVVVSRERMDPLFRQVRVGRDERSFSIWKLRTMHPKTSQVGTHEIGADAVTPTGAFMRKYKIDELPQVLNVLLGQMSFVGPRPCLPVQTELLAERRARGVFSVRPGITGLSQVRGVDMSVPAVLAELDARYLAMRTFGLDLRILWQTLAGRGFGDRVALERGVPEVVNDAAAERSGER